MAAVGGGMLRVAASFMPNVDSDAARQLLYLLIDVLLLLGVLGFYELRYGDVGRSGAVGFLFALVGLSVVRSSRAIPGVDLYPMGALALALGLLTLGVSAWKVKTLALWVPVTLLASILAGFVGTFVADAGWLFVLSGVAFGVAFAGLGHTVWSDVTSTRNHA
jgi:hypothetical protein